VLGPCCSSSETTQFQQLTVPGCCVPLRGFALEVEGLVEHFARSDTQLPSQHVSEAPRMVRSETEYQ
jgi:hypothetical protein